MTKHEASRTLVKSPPELWAECSDADSLARHLDRFGEIRITRLEPETAVAWEGELASGTVRLEPSGWGTTVILTAAPVAAEPAPLATKAVTEVAREPLYETQIEPEPLYETHVEPEPLYETQIEPEPEPDVAAEPEPSVAPAPREGLWGRVRRWLMGPAVPLSPPIVLDPPEPAPEVLAPDPAPGPVVPEPEPEPVSAPEPEAGSAPPPGIDAGAALTAALDSLGQAHHRPFSRA